MPWNVQSAESIRITGVVQILLRCYKCPVGYMLLGECDRFSIWDATEYKLVHIRVLLILSNIRVYMSIIGCEILNSHNGVGKDLCLL